MHYDILGNWASDIGAADKDPSIVEARRKREQTTTKFEWFVFSSTHKYFHSFPHSFPPRVPVKSVKCLKNWSGEIKHIKVILWILLWDIVCRVIGPIMHLNYHFIS